MENNENSSILNLNWKVTTALELIKNKSNVTDQVINKQLHKFNHKYKNIYQASLPNLKNDVFNIYQITQHILECIFSDLKTIQLDSVNKRIQNIIKVYSTISDVILNGLTLFKTQYEYLLKNQQTGKVKDVCKICESNFELMKIQSIKRSLPNFNLKIQTTSIAKQISKIQNFQLQNYEDILKQLLTNKNEVLSSQPSDLNHILNQSLSFFNESKYNKELFDEMKADQLVTIFNESKILIDEICKNMNKQLLAQMKKGLLPIIYQIAEAYFKSQVRKQKSNAVDKETQSSELSNHGLARIYQLKFLQSQKKFELSLDKIDELYRQINKVKSEAEHKKKLNLKEIDEYSQKIQILKKQNIEIQQQLDNYKQYITKQKTKQRSICKENIGSSANIKTEKSQKSLQNIKNSSQVEVQTDQFSIYDILPNAKNFAQNRVIIKSKIEKQKFQNLKSLKKDGSRLSIRKLNHFLKDSTDISYNQSHKNSVISLTPLVKSNFDDISQNHKQNLSEIKQNDLQNDKQMLKKFVRQSIRPFQKSELMLKKDRMQKNSINKLLTHKRNESDKSDSLKLNSGYFENSNNDGVIKLQNDKSQKNLNQISLKQFNYDKKYKNKQMKTQYSVSRNEPTNSKPFYNMNQDQIETQKQVSNLKSYRVIQSTNLSFKQNIENSQNQNGQSSNKIEILKNTFKTFKDYLILGKDIIYKQFIEALQNLNSKQHNKVQKNIKKLKVKLNEELNKQDDVSQEELKNIESNDNQNHQNISIPLDKLIEQKDQSIEYNNSHSYHLESQSSQKQLKQHKIKIKNQFIIQDLELFNGIAESYQFQTSLKKQIVQNMNLKHSLNLTENLKYQIRSIYSYIESLKKYKKSNFIKIKNFLRFPYQTVINKFQILDVTEQFSYQQFEYIFYKILSIHKNCIVSKTYCSHISSFLCRIDYVDVTNNAMSTKPLFPSI